MERRAFVRGNGDVDEYLLIRLHNRSPQPFPLAGIWLKVPVTDAICDVLQVADGLPEALVPRSGLVDAQFLVAVQARGNVLPGSQRTIGVHLLCRERCTVQADRITFRDPFLLGAIDVLDVSLLQVTVSVVFPPDDRLRHVQAPHALETTSRAATWAFSPAAHRPHHLYACLERASRPAATWLLDDALAALHECIARDACAEPLDLEQGLAPVLELLTAQGISLPPSVTALAGVARLTAEVRQQRLRQALQDLSRPHFRLPYVESLTRRSGSLTGVETGDDAAGGTEHDVGDTARQAGGDANDAGRDAFPRMSSAGRSSNAAVASPTPAFSCEHEYRVVSWRDQQFRFNPRQAKVIAALDGAFRAKARDLPEETLLSRAGWNGSRLRDYFKRHAAWETLIVRGERKGTWRLDL